MLQPAQWTMAPTHTSQGESMKYHPIMLLFDNRRPMSSRRQHPRSAEPQYTTLPAVGTAAFHVFVLRLANDVAEHGIDRFEPQVSRLARLASGHRVSRVSVHVMADRTEPRAARERALANVIGALVTPIELAAVAA
jgi:hypothetical protein